MTTCFLLANCWEAGKRCYHCLVETLSSHMSHCGAYWRVYVGYLKPRCLQLSEPAVSQDNWSEMGFLGPQQGKWPPAVGTMHWKRSSPKPCQGEHDNASRLCLKCSDTNVTLSPLFSAPVEQSSASLGKVLGTFMLLYDAMMSPPDLLIWGRTFMGVFQQWSRYSPSSL